MPEQEFKVKNNPIRSLPFLNYTTSAEVSKVVTDENITCLHTNKGKFCAPNSDLGEMKGIDSLVIGLKGGDRDIKIQMGAQGNYGYEETTFIEKGGSGREAPVKVQIRVPFFGGGKLQEFIGILRKEEEKK